MQLKFLRVYIVQNLGKIRLRNGLVEITTKT